MEVNFEQDLREALQYQLSDYQVKLTKKEKLQDGLLDYLSILKKLVRPIPRVVKFNPELFKNLEQHPKKKEILHLKNFFEKGTDVNLFQSKRLFQSNFHDHMVYEWNIFHFHLALEKEKKGQFIKQVKQLLFVHIAEDQVIFLGTDNHEPGTFGDTKWQEVLYDHFPEILEPYRDKNITELYPKVNSLERQTLWDKGYMLAMTTIRGKVFHNPGIGRTTSGHSMLVTKQTNEIMRWLWQITEQFQRLRDKICIFLKIDHEAADFHLQFGSRTLEVYEKSTKKIILTYRDIINEELFPDINATA